MELKLNLFLVFSLLCLIKIGQTIGNPNSQKSLELMFKNIGSYSGKTKAGQSYTKQYYIPIFFRVYWHEVKGICSQYGMEVATFESKEESEKILDILRWNGTNTNAGVSDYFVGGVSTVPKSKKDWFWADSGERIDYDLRWNTIDQLDNTNGIEFCLSLIYHTLYTGYNDLPCDSYNTIIPQSFICQKKKGLFDA